EADDADQHPRRARQVRQAPHRPDGARDRRAVRRRHDLGRHAAEDPVGARRGQERRQHRPHHRRPRPARDAARSPHRASLRNDDPLALKHPVWLFDLDNTLHDASNAAFGEMHVAIGDYVVEHVGVSHEEADRLRQKYWLRYGATLLGLVRHHGIRAAHFLDQTHRLPGLEERLRTSTHDRAALARLPGPKFILTNAPRAYAMRVLTTLRLLHHFDGVLTIADMTMLGALRPQP